MSLFGLLLGEDTVTARLVGSISLLGLILLFFYAGGPGSYSGPLERGPPVILESAP